MHTISSTFWAKKREENGLYQWLSLGQHLEDTRKVAIYLWHNWLSGGQKLLVIESLEIPDEDTALNLVQFIAAVHDIGKALPNFQTKVGFNTSSDLDQLLIEKVMALGFDHLSSERFICSSHTPHALAGQVILQQAGVNEQIASIIGGHHGKPIDDDFQIESQYAYKKNYYQTENKNSPVYLLWQQEQRKILERALEVSGFSSPEDVPTISQPSQVILSGLLIMADWIASNDEFFPLLNVDEDIEKINQEERISTGITKWGQVQSITFRDQSDIDYLYMDRFSFSPRSFQDKFSKVIDSTENAGIFILEAPMGLGKTEAALIGAEQLAYKKGRGGIFFGLPTQATANGIFPRIKNWIERIHEEYGEKISVQLSHGKANLNEEYNQLLRSSLTYGNEDTGVLVNQWFIGKKKKILDDIVVGTVDQFLLIGLKQKHLALRHLAFSKKVVIIDEVHAYDAYTSQYLNEALTWMGAYDVPIIMLSATLPAKRREEFVIAYLKGKDIKKSEIELPLEGLSINDYPLITYNEGNEIKQFKDFDKMKETEVKIAPFNESDLEELLKDLMTKEGVIGIVCNTVLKAQNIAKVCSAIFGDGQVELLHSSFIASERAKKELDLLNMIGKGAKRPKQKIIVGTQVIEQSLDIDFDVMISELAPMDLLIQRIGRLHRHNIDRPKAFKLPILYVMGMSESFEFDEGSKSIYGDYLLLMTQYYLPATMKLPTDISDLVQKVYSDEHSYLEKDIEQSVNRFKASYDEKIKSKTERAKSYKLSDPVYQGGVRYKTSLIGWLKHMSSADTEEHGYAQVRDSQETIEVIAVRKMKGGYGLFGQDRLISDKVTDPQMAQELLKNSLRLPGVLTRFEKNINQIIQDLEVFNKKYLSDWQEQVWLKGSLGIIFDENNNFELNNCILHYDEKFGLSYERKDSIGKI
ncbi:CRISPR-associated helicase Cas3' [Tuanshanicoccus lijuaniae]|uniref:CRISPR-associated helicase Cas3' n=1 Tax=Aerococcaceae bacterium zg-1292 TaxID=2774330 RepID=UPI00193548D6|nr:CRISPR-associated helicase Cas3' [Aerococcaceae bacterium zg-1292]QQA38192.1 CRISPR-associated helicase Cas3' [Aerococcaceae bacterium zg-1292]